MMNGTVLIIFLILGPALAAPAAYLLRRRNMHADAFVFFMLSVFFAASAVCCLYVFSYGEHSVVFPELSGLGMSFRLDGFRALYILLSSLLWLVSTIFSKEYFGDRKDTGRYSLFLLLTLSAVNGVFLSSDFVTVIIFFEIMSLVSYPLVVHEQTPAALRAGETYLAVGIIGGLAMMMGLFILADKFGTLDFEAVRNASGLLQNRSSLYLPGTLLLFGFGAKAGMFPLHIWLPKAHPAAPAPASALLSGILTKTGIFGILAVSSTLFAADFSWGTALLIPAVITMVWGALQALLSSDIKRMLACSSVSQIGFIITGVSVQVLLGEHNALAVRGTIIHMVNHSVLKLVLFVLSGVIYKNLHSLELSSIRGFGRKKPLFAFMFLMSALGLSGVPFWNGYISKTLLHESILEAAHLYAGTAAGGIISAAEILFVITGGLTAAYMLKLSVSLFIMKPKKEMPAGRYMSKPAGISLSLISLLMPLLGSFPGLSEGIAAFAEGFVHGHAPEHAVHYFEWINLKGALISLSAGIVIYAAAVRPFQKRGKEPAAMLPLRADLEDMLYRPLLSASVTAGAFFARIAETLPAAAGRAVLKTVLRKSSAETKESKFYSRFYWYFFPGDESRERDSKMTGTLSHALMLFGAGICIILLYVFSGTL